MTGPELSYALLMDQVLIERAKVQRAYNPLRPSSAGQCARRLYHDLRAYKGKAELIKEERKPSVERLLSLGHYIEEQVLDELKAIPGFAVRFNQQVVDLFTLDDGQTIEGSMDAVMWSEDTKGVLDAKTVGDRFHAAFFSKWEGMKSDYSKMNTLTQFDENAWYAGDLEAFLKQLGTDDSLYKNLLQVNSYACTPFMQNRGVDHGSILRYNKNNSHLMELRFKPHMGLFEQMRTKFNNVNVAVATDDESLAPKERVLGQMDCAYCPYKALCWPTAKRGEFYSGSKQWATRVSELEKGKDLEALFTQYDALESQTKDLTKIKQEIILLIEGHGQKKVKRDNGQVFEVKTLQKGAELRLGKE